jgi:hypothetical protein
MVTIPPGEKILQGVILIKIWLFLMVISIPGQPSVKYDASIYATELQCMEVRERYMKSFQAKSHEYRLNMKTEAFCIPFESFPIIGMKSPMGA